MWPGKPPHTDAQSDRVHMQVIAAAARHDKVPKTSTGKQVARQVVHSTKALADGSIMARAKQAAAEAVEKGLDRLAVAKYVQMQTLAAVEEARRALKSNQS